jgi:hypothetical protein
MFDSEGASGVLKVLDFGSSVFVQPSETVSRPTARAAAQHSTARRAEATAGRSKGAAAGPPERPGLPRPKGAWALHTSRAARSQARVLHGCV